MSINNHVILTELECIEDAILKYGKERYETDINSFFQKRSLGISDYIEQLEKNTPYNLLLYSFANSMIVSYFHANSESSGNKVYEYFAMLGQKEASKEAPTVINYLKTGVGSDNPYCQNLAPLRDISIKNPKDYVEELEFSLSCYKSRYIVADLFLKIMSSSSCDEFRKYFAKNLTPDQIYDLIEARFKILGNKIIGNYKEVSYRVDR